MSEQNVQVTQADREAAADLYANVYSMPLDHYYVATLRSGASDGHPIVQAFARHRTRAEPDLVEAAKRVLEWWPEGSEENSLAGKSRGGTFAADIQALRATLTRADGEVK